MPGSQHSISLTIDKSRYGHTDRRNCGRCPTQFSYELGHLLNHAFVFDGGRAVLDQLTVVAH